MAFNRPVVRSLSAPPGRPSPSGGIRKGFFVPAAALLAGTLVLSACLPAVSPREGRPVEAGTGKALVFGRIRVTSPEYRREFLSFSKDPMEHMLPPDPVFNLELRGIRPAGGAVRYASNPAPKVEGDGSFYWILPYGDYVLASNPRPYGSSRFDPQETTALARFSVPPGAGTVYLGTLEIVVRFGTVDLVDAFKGRETLYSILRLSVADEDGQASTCLLKRFPSVPEPRATVPMAPEPR